MRGRQAGNRTRKTAAILIHCGRRPEVKRERRKKVEVKKGVGKKRGSKMGRRRERNKRGSGQILREKKEAPSSVGVKKEEEK